jgi:hypothetical protein
MKLSLQIHTEEIEGSDTEGDDVNKWIQPYAESINAMDGLCFVGQEWRK